MSAKRTRTRSMLTTTVVVNNKKPITTTTKITPESSKRDLQRHMFDSSTESGQGPHKKNRMDTNNFPKPQICRETVHEFSPLLPILHQHTPLSFHNRLSSEHWASNFFADLDNINQNVGGGVYGDGQYPFDFDYEYSTSIIQNQEENLISSSRSSAEDMSESSNCANEEENEACYSLEDTNYCRRVFCEPEIDNPTKVCGCCYGNISRKDRGNLQCHGCTEFLCGKCYNDNSSRCPPCQADEFQCRNCYTEAAIIFNEYGNPEAHLFVCDGCENQICEDCIHDFRIPKIGDFESFAELQERSLIRSCNKCAQPCFRCKKSLVDTDCVFKGDNSICLSCLTPQERKICKL